MNTLGRIDTHHHVVPPEYAAWLTSHGLDAGGLPIPHWSAHDALTLMDSIGVQTAILSLSTPAVFLGGTRHNAADARAMARTVNEFNAAVVADHPGRFGFFATVPLPDVDAALEEVAYTFDHLGADGVILLANTDGVYLGDPATDALFDELDRRKAVVFVHPSHLPGPTVPGVPAFMADFLLDTTRAALKLTMSGTLDRCPNVKVILSHAGGFLPYAAYRVAPFCSPDFLHAGGVEKLQRFSFDTALSSSAAALPSLQAFADPTRILFGSDWPYAPEPVVRFFVGQYESVIEDKAARYRIDRGNAEVLFPRLARNP